jgi:hypothetical protein
VTSGSFWGCFCSIGQVGGFSLDLVCCRGRGHWRICAATHRSTAARRTVVGRLSLSSSRLTTELPPAGPGSRSAGVRTSGPRSAVSELRLAARALLEMHVSVGGCAIEVRRWCAKGCCRSRGGFPFSLRVERCLDLAVQPANAVGWDSPTMQGADEAGIGNVRPDPTTNGCR